MAKKRDLSQIIEVLNQILLNFFSKYPLDRIDYFQEQFIGTVHLTYPFEDPQDYNHPHKVYDATIYSKQSEWDPRWGQVHNYQLMITLINDQITLSEFEILEEAIWDEMEEVKLPLLVELIDHLGCGTCQVWLRLNKKKSSQLEISFEQKNPNDAKESIPRMMIVIKIGPPRDPWWMKQGHLVDLEKKCEVSEKN